MEIRCATAYFDEERGEIRAMRGFTGEWEWDESKGTNKEKGRKIKKQTAPIDFKARATAELDLRKIVIGGEKDVFEQVGKGGGGGSKSKSESESKSKVAAEQEIQNNFEPENIRRIQARGGCEALFNSHMTEVYHQRRVEDAKRYEVLQRSIYLFHLRELHRVKNEKERNYSFSAVKKKLKKKDKGKRRTEEVLVEEGGAGGGVFSPPQKVVPVVKL